MSEDETRWDVDVTRGAFLKQGLLAGVAASGLPAVLAELANAPSAAAALNKVKPGVPQGTLRVALSTFNEGTYLPNTGSGTRQIYTSPILEYPYMAGYARPGLAQGLLTSLDLSKDGLTLTGRVRPGVKFHDGSRMTSEDIAYALELMTSPNSLVALAPTLRQVIKNVDYSNPNVVKVILNTPYAGLPGQLSSYGLFAGITSKKYVQSVGQAAADKTPIGTGPYRFVSQSLDTINLQAVNSHWRVVPQFKQLQFLNVPEASSAVDLLETNGVDLISPDIQSAAKILHDPRFKVFAYPNAYVLMLLFGNNYISTDKRYTGKQPYSDIRVREALNIAIDRNAIVKAVYKGFAKPARIGEFDPILPDNVKPYPYDPKKAKALLAAAGYANGFYLILNSWPFSPGSELPQVIQIVAEYWQQIGVRAQIVPGQYASFRPKWFAGQAAGQVWGIAGSGFEIGWQSWAQRFYAVNSPIAVYESDAFSYFINQWAKETTPAASAATAKIFAKHCYDNYSEIGLAVADGVYIANKKAVGHYAPPASWYQQYYEYTTHNPSTRTPVHSMLPPNPAWRQLSEV